MTVFPRVGTHLRQQIHTGDLFGWGPLVMRTEGAGYKGTSTESQVTMKSLTAVSVEVSCASLFRLIDLYYRHPNLFVKQTVVDRYVDDIACTLGVPRSRLNVVRFALFHCLHPLISQRLLLQKVLLLDALTYNARMAHG